MHVQVEQLCKSYIDGEKNKLSILKGLDLSLDTGESVSIVGTSGVGKSTLLHILGGLDHADSGEIFMDGKDLLKFTSSAMAAFRNQQVGFIFQFHHLLKEFTALENVMMPLRIGGLSLSASKKRASELLSQVELSHRMTHRPPQLSGGEQQRVAIARAIANNPSLLLADEPTGSLDIETGTHIMELLHQLNVERKITLVLITHNQSIAESTKTQYHLENGCLEKIR